VRPSRGKKARGGPKTLVVTAGPLTGTKITLGDQPILIGRADDSTLVLTDDFASSRHARLTNRSGQWYVEDLGSTNGTYLDQQRVQGPAAVAPGPADPHRPDGPGAALVTGPPAREPGPMSLALRYAARSDRGLVRGNNQDSVYAGPRLLAVADGMGGHAAGDVASKVVIAALEHLDDDAPSGDMLQALREAVYDGSEHLREVIRESPAAGGHGAPRSPPSCSPAAGWRCATSATRAPTCCATARCSRSPTTTRSSRR
jgi:hypothetical protein